MRVKLSYTVDADDILREAAKILGLSQEDVGHAIQMFKAVQEELRKEDTPPNTTVVVEMIEDFRKALAAIDTRLVEVGEIIKNYQLQQLEAQNPPAPEWAPRGDYFGAD
jgi:hypothetical protein